MKSGGKKASASAVKNPSRKKSAAVTLETDGARNRSSEQISETLAGAVSVADRSTPREDRRQAVSYEAPLITPELRRHMVEKAAYLRAEARGFQGGNSEHDWLEAESEIDALLMRSRTSREE